MHSKLAYTSMIFGVTLTLLLMTFTNQKCENGSIISNDGITDSRNLGDSEGVSDGAYVESNDNDSNVINPLDSNTSSLTAEAEVLVGIDCHCECNHLSINDSDYCGSATTQNMIGLATGQNTNTLLVVGTIDETVNTETSIVDASKINIFGFNDLGILDMAETRSGTNNIKNSLRNISFTKPESVDDNTLVVFAIKANSDGLPPESGPITIVSSKNNRFVPLTSDEEQHLKSVINLGISKSSESEIDAQMVNKADTSWLN